MTRAIDVRQLRYFVAVAQERSFRRAAERLHLTQPPLSRQIAELERQLGVRLLARDTRRVQLTAAGELALREFAAALGRFDASVARVAAAAPAAGRLRLGVLYWSDLKALAGVERRLKTAGLCAGLDVHTTSSHEAVAAVQRGELDAAVVAAPTDLHRLDGTVLGTARLAAFVPAASPLARRRVLALKDLETLPPFFRFARHFNPRLHDHFTQQYEAHGFRPRELAGASEAMGVLAQIARGRGCTCMPDLAARYRYAGVVRRPLREAVTMDLALVVSPRLDPALRATLFASARRLLPAAWRRRQKT
jgi:DNA-binding transcriptional LysR family regulator